MGIFGFKPISKFVLRNPKDSGDARESQEPADPKEDIDGDAVLGLIAPENDGVDDNEFDANFFELVQSELSKWVTNFFTTHVYIANLVARSSHSRGGEKLLSTL